MSHSKRNTSLAFFTAFERDELKSTWGSRSTRLTRDSFLPFGSCQLCLLPARSPVVCPSYGHLFCRECAMSNLLAQNKELKRLRKEAERRKVEDVEVNEFDEAERKGRELEEFERIQAGLSGKDIGKRYKNIVGMDRGAQRLEDNPNGGKRKLEVDEDGISGKTDDGERKAQRRSSDHNGGNEKLPSFWVPSKTPDNKKSDLKAIRHHPVCPAAAADKPHDFTLKTFVTLNFTEDRPSDGGTGAATRICPSCNKALTNSTKAVLGKPCGHVLCKPCSDKFQIPAPKALDTEREDPTVLCYVCNEDVTPGRKVRRKKRHADDGGEKERESFELGLVELSSEGTGFAGGGKNMVKKQGVAFQC